MEDISQQRTGTASIWPHRRAQVKQGGWESWLGMSSEERVGDGFAETGCAPIKLSHVGYGKE